MAEPQLVPKRRLRMNPGTVHRIYQEMRQVRGLLTTEKKWLYATQVKNPERLQGFLRIEFWRHVLLYADTAIRDGYEIDLAVLEDDSEFR